MSVWTIAAAAAIASRRFFGFAADSTTPAPRAFGALKPSIAPIHFGVAACSSPCGLPRHCFAAISTSNAPSTSFSVLAHVAGVPPSLVPLGETSSTIAPTSESPSSQPTTNAGPLARARGVTSIRTTPMIGIGLIATPTASDRI